MCQSWSQSLAKWKAGGPVLCSRRCDGATNLPASLGLLQNIPLAHQACTTYTSKLLREPGLSLAVMGQLLLGYPSVPLLALPWSAEGYIPIREPRARCFGAACSSGVRIDQRWDGTKEEQEFKPKVYPFTCITSATEKLYTYTIQSRWWLARPQGLLWQGMVLLGVGSGTVRLQRGEARPGKCIPTVSFQEVLLAGSPGKGLSCTLSAQLSGGHSHPRQQTLVCTRTHTHTHTPNYEISEEYMFPNLKRNKFSCTAVHVAFCSSVFPNRRLVI